MLTVRKRDFVFAQCQDFTLLVSYQMYASVDIQCGIVFESWCLEWIYVSI